MPKAPVKTISEIATETGVSVGRLRRAAEALRIDTSRGSTFTKLQIAQLVAQAKKTSKNRLMPKARAKA
jgi:phage portal protein BeeE